MMDLINKIIASKFIKWGFNGNVWSWFHILGGGVLARILIIWLDPGRTLLWVLIIALLWEVFEWYAEDQEEVYGSVERFWWDAAGDVIGAVACAVLVVSMVW
jgi:hypothetical protein